MRALLNKWMDNLSQRLPAVTKWLWVPSLAGLVYALYLMVSSDRPGMSDLFENVWMTTPLEWFGPYQVLVLLGLAFVMSLLYLVKKKDDSGAGAWLSLGTWSSLLVLLNYYLVFADFPFFSYLRVSNYVSGVQGLHLPPLVRQIVEMCLYPFDLTWIVVIALFAVVLEVHRRQMKGTNGRQIQIGGSWAPWKATLFATFVAMMIANVGPFVGTILFPSGFEQSLSVGSKALAFVFVLLAWFAGFMVYAWKTGAFIAFKERRFSISFAETGLGILSVPWKRALRVREQIVAGVRDAVRLDFGVLPVFRARMSLHRSRDGGEALDRLFNEAQSRGVCQDAVRVRRGTGIAGLVAIAASLALAFTVLQLMVSWTAQMNASVDSFTKNFVGKDGFLTLGLLTGLAALCLGLGIGLRSARTDASARSIPLIISGAVAALLPDALIYWLVNIAIYAILTARLAPLETQAWIPFPDYHVAIVGMWMVGAKALFGVVGYLLAMFIAVKPWYRALPSWPYAIPKRRERQPERAQEAVTQMDAPAPIAS